MAAGRKTGGRQKGTPNKATAAVKDALTEAFGELGGVPSLVTWGRDQPGEFYKLWVKMLPQEIKADVAADVKATVRRIELVAVNPDGRDRTAQDPS